MIKHDYVYIQCDTLPIFGLRNYLVTSYRILVKLAEAKTKKCFVRRGI